MFSNFPTPKNYNLGGLVDFKFVHRSDVQAWPGVFDSKIALAITLKIGIEWLKGYATPQTLNFEEVLREVPVGKFYEQTVSGFAPGDTADLIDLMEKMGNHDFVLQIKDKNNQTRLIGGHGYPLTFSASFNSGNGIADNRGYNFKFIGVSIIRAPVYL